MTKYCNNHACVDRDLCRYADPDNELPDHSNVFLGRGFDNKTCIEFKPDFVVEDVAVLAK